MTQNELEKSQHHCWRQLVDSLASVPGSLHMGLAVRIIQDLLDSDICPQVEEVFCRSCQDAVARLSDRRE